MPNNSRGIEKAKKIYTERFLRTIELKREGYRILGYICPYVPVEMITAFQIIPFRIIGNIYEPSTQVNRFLPQTFCPFIRNIFDLALKKVYDFLDGVIWVHSCDPIERTGRIWQSVLQPHYFYFLDLPTKISERHQKFFKEGLNDLRKTLEELAEKELRYEELEKAIQAYNEQRVLVRGLYENTKKNPPKILHSEILQIIATITSIPIEEGNKLLKEILNDIKNIKNQNHGEDKSPRLLIWGSILDNSLLSEMIENLGAHIVIDDLCIGTRGFQGKVKMQGDLMESLAHYYLMEMRCPRTFRGINNAKKRKNYLEDLEERFGYLGEFIKAWRVDAVILQLMKYCDCHGFEVPQLKDYFSKLGIPTLVIEHNYTDLNKENLKIRIEAFLEMIQGNF